MSQERRVLGEDWFPTVEVSVESIRERSASSALPPTYYLHVWFARRPLTTSRAAILAALVDSNFDKKSFLKIVGIPPDKNIVGAVTQLMKAKSSGRMEKSPFNWPRAFTVNSPNSIFPSEKSIVVLDPMAGGGSIPFEAIRLGLNTIAGDLNPVAWLCLKGTVEYPARFGMKLLPALEVFCNQIHREAQNELRHYFPKPDTNDIFAYLWARTIRCNQCGLTIPLSPNWWIVNGEEKGVAAKPIISSDGKSCNFIMIKNPKKYGFDPDIGTWRDGDALCLSCGSVVDGAYIKTEAQASRMGHQMYAVCCKTQKIRKQSKEWVFRTPTDIESRTLEKLEEEVKLKIPEWEKKELIPKDKFPEDANDTRPIMFGMPYWRDMFNYRQLLTHAIYLEKFKEAKTKLFQNREVKSEE